MWHAWGSKGTHTESMLVAKYERKRPFVEPRIMQANDIKTDDKEIT